MFKRLWVLVIGLALMETFAAYAQTEPPESDEVVKETQALDQAAAKAGNDKVFQTLSKQLNVPVSDLQAQQQSTHFGFGQLFIANALANATAKSATPKTFQQIADEFNAGKGWGQIANQNGVKLGSIISSIKRSDKAIQAQQRNENRVTGAQGVSNAPMGEQNRPSQSAGPKGHGNGHGRPK